MIISNITINELREVDSLTITYKLVDCISKEKWRFIKSESLSFMLRNVEINTLNLDIDI